MPKFFFQRKKMGWFSTTVNHPQGQMLLAITLHNTLLFKKIWLDVADNLSSFDIVELISCASNVFNKDILKIIYDFISIRPEIYTLDFDDDIFEVFDYLVMKIIIILKNNHPTIRRESEEANLCFQFLYHFSRHARSVNKNFLKKYYFSDSQLSSDEHRAIVETCRSNTKIQNIGECLRNIPNLF